LKFKGTDVHATITINDVNILNAKKNPFVVS